MKKEEHDLWTNWTNLAGSSHTSSSCGRRTTAFRGARRSWSCFLMFVPRFVSDPVGQAFFFIEIDAFCLFVYSSFLQCVLVLDFQCILMCLSPHRVFPVLWPWKSGTWPWDFGTVFGLWDCRSWAVFSFRFGWPESGLHATVFRSEHCSAFCFLCKKLFKNWLIRLKMFVSQSTTKLYN
jgi:hypothetical protein